MRFVVSAEKAAECFSIAALSAAMENEYISANSASRMSGANGQ